MWKIKPTNRFKSSYSNLREEMVQRVDSALEGLAGADRPERLGIAKKAS